MYRVIRDFCEHFYTNTLDNLEEKDKFLDTYNLLILAHEKKNRKFNQY